MRRWVKVPGPGEFRGEGEWQEYDPLMQLTKLAPTEAEARWRWLHDNHVLPTHEGEEPPEAR